MKAAVATDVTVDLAGLDCTLCLALLRPPVFQCAAGHVICSTCYEKLLENDYCQLCSVSASYSRCFAVERVLQSVKVPCSNVGYGCMAKMPYYEIEDHEMNCLKGVRDFSGSNTVQSMPLHHGLPTDHYTLLIPKVSPSVRMNISINNRESKISNRDDKKMHDKKSSTCDHKSSTGSVVKMGPCGGGGGNAWKMDLRGVNRIVKVVVRHGVAVDAMSVFYEQEGKEKKTKLWGGTGGKSSEICLKPGEYLTSVKGHYGFYNNWFVIRSLTFVSNRRNFGPFGKEEGAPFKLPATGGKIIGFHGRSGGLLDALGTYVQMG
ncbi:uncharacterized protein LOC124664267 [Lolium rigidum]|uniref:uncharacterized protein LOC124664267 n=1 Tax=Lolium rigidum TaxID=89674 RepID=UPI001F5D47AD|nr:uncharacterized protein LOC124664267 [Lolium rigidum]